MRSLAARMNVWVFGKLAMGHAWGQNLGAPPKRGPCWGGSPDSEFLKWVETHIKSKNATLARSLLRGELSHGPTKCGTSLGAEQAEGEAKVRTLVSTERSVTLRGGVAVVSPCGIHRRRCRD